MLTSLLLYWQLGCPSNDHWYQFYQWDAVHRGKFSKAHRQQGIELPVKAGTVSRLCGKVNRVQVPTCCVPLKIPHLTCSLNLNISTNIKAITVLFSPHLEKFQQFVLLSNHTVHFIVWYNWEYLENNVYILCLPRELLSYHLQCS